MEEKIKQLIEELKAPYDGYDDDEGNCSAGYNLAMEFVIAELTEILNENNKAEVLEDLPDDYDGSDIGCKDCPDDECTGHCMSCPYRPI